MSGYEVMSAFQSLVKNKCNYSKERSPELFTHYQELPIEEAKSWHVMHYFPGNIERLLHKINLLFEHIPASKCNQVEYSSFCNQHVFNSKFDEVCNFS